MVEKTKIPSLGDRLELILEVGRAFSSVLNIDVLLNLIADHTADILNADRCSIFVVDAGKNKLWTRAAMGEGRIEIPADTGIAGAVAATGEIINVPDAYADNRFNKDIDRATGYKTENLLAGPMTNINGDIIGVFQVLNSKNRVFSRDDEQLLSALSGFAGNALENSLLYEELKRTFNSMVEVLAATIDAKHPYTAGHTARVAEYSCGIAREMGLDEAQIEILRIAAYLHDYGKIGIKDVVLTKPGKLTDEEYLEMKSHAAKTREILSKMHFERKFKDIPLIAGSHHEKFDGSGYPQKLSGESIPLGARIMAIADVFDALTSDRDYRKAMPFNKAVELMKKEVGAAFDPRIFPFFENYFQKELNDQS
ncbi:MAG: HD domain-containing protein [candidate division Zixibacteria bacterium]|nr:HD domain-containing protein [candidate division Zixibacteria bacterium]